MKFLKNTLVIAAVLMLASCASKKLSPERVDEVTNKIQRKDYSIAVNYAHPMRGSQIYLNDSYDLTVKGDSVIAYLPYYGEAKVAPLNPVEGGIKFSEPMMDYKITPKGNNDGWDITFKVNAREYQYDFTLSIFNNGTSSFTVNSVQRDPITFSGNLKGLTTEREAIK